MADYEFAIFPGEQTHQHAEVLPANLEATLPPSFRFGHRIESDAQWQSYCKSLLKQFRDHFPIAAVLEIVTLQFSFLYGYKGCTVCEILHKLNCEVNVECPFGVNSSRC